MAAAGSLSQEESMKSEAAQKVSPGNAPRPDPKYRTRPPEWFLGKYVKKAFPGVYPPTCQIHAEHMFVKIGLLLSAAQGRVLTGKLANRPALQMELKEGDEVSVHIDEIEEVKDR